MSNAIKFKNLLTLLRYSHIPIAEFTHAGRKYLNILPLKPFYYLIEKFILPFLRFTNKKIENYGIIKGITGSNSTRIATICLANPQLSYPLMAVSFAFTTLSAMIKSNTEQYLEDLKNEVSQMSIISQLIENKSLIYKNNNPKQIDKKQYEHDKKRSFSKLFWQTTFENFLRNIVLGVVIFAAGGNTSILYGISLFTEYLAELAEFKKDFNNTHEKYIKLHQSTPLLDYNNSQLLEAISKKNSQEIQKIIDKNSNSETALLKQPQTFKPPQESFNNMCKSFTKEFSVSDTPFLTILAAKKAGNKWVESSHLTKSLNDKER